MQAVEQLGLDKAVPSRILEIMGIDCLTRHNIASHLQVHIYERFYIIVRGCEKVFAILINTVFATVITVVTLEINHNLFLT